MTSWSTALPRLAILWQRGQLVPFLGAGMSRPICASWSEFVERLEDAAGVDGDGASTDPESLMRRANLAVRTLRLRNPEAVVRVARDALVTSVDVDDVEIPLQTQLLADTWWPLAITTNYDDLFPTALAKRWKTVPSVLGRSAVDCFLVGRALREPMDPVVWAIHGYVDAPVGEAGLDPDGLLANELVIGHEEYTRVTHREHTWRRTFIEVYRNRSLLFVGSSLAERYLLDLFAEVRETYGPNSQQHWALAPRGQLDVDFLQQHYQIAVVEYDPKDGHAELRDLLRDLARATTRGCAETAWRYRVPTSAGEARFDVDVSPLPERRPPVGECVAVSVGGRLDQPHAYTGVAADKLFKALGLHATGIRWEEGGRVGRLPGEAIYVVRPRQENARGPSLSAVYEGTKELLDVVVRDGFSVLRSTTLASGAALGGRFEPRYRPLHAFAEMAAAYGEWARAGGPRARMIVHLVDPGIYTELRRGRLDVAEALACEDFRFWVTIESPGQPPEYHLVHAKTSEALGALAERLQVPGGWWVHVWPSPSAGWKPQKVQDLEDAPLVGLAVLGSTLRFTTERR